MTPFLLALAALAKAPDPAETAALLVEEALRSDVAWERLVELSDDIGPRLSGTPGHERAMEWAQAAMTEDGLVNVRTEPVTVIGWERGEERAALLAPVAEPLPMLGLGNSVGTEGIDADVVVVGSFEELEAIGEGVRGKIVLYDVPFTTYGEVAPYRWGGPDAASKHGAVATLIRSVGPVGANTLHTGTLHYGDEVPRIPGAAVSAEDAMRIRRYVERGLTVRVHLEMGARSLGELPSANVIGEVRGKKKNEFVVLACHLDSWDVGRGAQDDGAGCVQVMEAARLIAALPQPPGRTIRVVLYTNEENGVAGGKAYAADHAKDRHVAAIESDTGAGPVGGFTMDLGERPAGTTVTGLVEVEPLLAALGSASFTPGHAGTDLTALVKAGVLGFGVTHDTTGYWPVHHTSADTVDKVDPEVLRKNVASIAVLAWWLAHSPPVIGSSEVTLPPEGR